MNARRACGFARAAIQTQFQVPAHAIAQLGPAIGHRPHELDAAARTVVFVPQLGERRTARRTQPAMNAAEEQVVADSCRRVLAAWLVRVVEAVGGHAMGTMPEKQYLL